MSTAFLNRQRDQTECDGEHRHANHAGQDIHGSLTGKAKTLLLGIGLQVIARRQSVGKGRGIKADRSLQTVVTSLLNGGRGALGVPLAPCVTRGQQAQRRGAGRVPLPEKLVFSELSFEEKKAVAAQFIRRIEVAKDSAEIIWAV